MVRVFVFESNVKCERVRTFMLPSATVIGEGLGLCCPSLSLCEHPFQPDRMSIAQISASAPHVFGYCVVRIFILLSLISGNHPQKGTPEPLQIGPGMVRLKNRRSPLTIDCFQLRLSG